ncbi:hypothetical protein ACJRO7_004712 [Eucalyptus globulus]|uniref:Uncharacterized protein n=1 Tax=Eucalyptus globulus TaxID=34317 RepID=A0ABD3IXW1_EUCGL
MHIDLSSSSRLFSPRSGDKKEDKLTPEELESISSSFDDSLLACLQGLSPASVSLAWLSSAVDALNFAHSAVKALLPHLELDKPDGLSSWYSDYSRKVLGIRSEIAQLRDHHVKLRIVIEPLHSNPNPLVEDIRRVRDLLVGSEEEDSDGVVKSSGNIDELIRDVTHTIRTSGLERKVSAVERPIRHMFHAADFMMAFVAGVVHVAFYPSPVGVTRICVPAEFPWGESFRMIERAITAGLGRNQEKERKTSMLKEFEDVEARLSHLIKAIDEVAASGSSGEITRRIREIAAELEKANGVLLEGVDRLTKAVDGLFVTAMEMMDGLRERLSPEMPLKAYFAMEEDKVKVISKI